MTEEKVIKKKKKNWYTILAPKEFENVVIGETLASNVNSIIGRVVSTNYVMIGSNVKKQSVNLLFKVREAKDDKLFTELVGYDLLGSFVKRLVRKQRSKIDDSIDVETKDKIKVKIKLLMLSKRITTSSKLSAVRINSRQLLKTSFEKEDFNTMVDMILKDRLQIFLKNRLKKIYPLAVCEVRSFRKLG